MAPGIEPLPLSALPPLPAHLPLAVVGHVEVVTLLEVDHLPRPGEVQHAAASLEEPAGGGAVVAVQLARLTGRRVPFFTALGRDDWGRRAVERLEALGLELQVAWREAPTRRGISFSEAGGERSITVIGERLSPAATDPLPWGSLAAMAGVFVTAADPGGLRLARRAAWLGATPRVRLPLLRQAAVPLDALIGSALDPGEHTVPGDLEPEPRLRIGTSGARGGHCLPGGAFDALPPPPLLRDSYGAGDSFAAGVSLGLAAGWTLQQALSLGCHCGRAVLEGLGPYATQLGGPGRPLA
ncbi:MAG: PfkB family carbohydrate kinase [Prochlorococcaceae cyanobacterium]|jgi:ribokinase